MVVERTGGEHLCTEETNAHELPTAVGSTIWCAAFSKAPNGRIAASGLDGPIGLFDDTLSKVDSINQDRRRATTSLAFSPEGTYLVASSFDASITTYSIASLAGPSLVSTFRPGHGERAVRFDPAFERAPKRRIASVGLDSVNLWDVDTREKQTGSFRQAGGKEIGRGLAVAWTPSSSAIVAAHSSGHLSSYNVSGLTLGFLARPHNTAQIRSLSFLDENSLLSASDDRVICVTDLRVPGTVVASLAGHNDWVTSVAARPGSANDVLSCSLDGTVRLWDLHARRSRDIVTPGVNAGCEVWAVDWDRDGTKCVVGGEGLRLQVYSVERSDRSPQQGGPRNENNLQRKRDHRTDTRPMQAQAFLRRRPGSSSNAPQPTASPANARKNVLSLLVQLLPSADSAYLESLLAFYDLTESPERVAQRIARKVFEVNHGEYPKAVGPEGLASSTSSRNAYLDELSELFPDADASFLRQCIIGESHTVVSKVSEKLLGLQKPGAAGYPRRLREGAPLESSDRFRTPQYSKGCLTRLCNDFPDRWKSTIRAVMAECNDDYIASHNRLASMGKSGWIPGFLSKMFQRRLIEEPAIYDLELLRDVDRLAAQRTLEVSKADAEIARKLNSDEYTSTGHAITCACCFDDLAWEDLAACPKGHVFCRACISRYVSEAVFGQQGGSAVDDRGFRCMDASEGTRCTALFEDSVVIACAGPDIFNKWTEKLVVSELGKSGLPYSKCLFCAYAEVDAEAEDRARGIPTGPDESFADLLRGLVYGSFTAAILAPFSAMFAFVGLMGWLVPAIVVRPLLRTLPIEEEHPVHRFLSWFLPAPPPPKPIPARMFKCRNERCLRKSCLTCNREWIGLHKCTSDWKSSLRLYVEQAMTLALVRTCPRCSLQFQKLEGCNKMTCPRCAYVMCYVCRKEIGSEKYGHFCQHFRAFAGPCRECDKCDLYKVEEDNKAVKEAGKRARERWLMEHPDAVGVENVNVGL